MSYTATKWAYDLPLTGSAKGILVALADMADEANSCYPGQEKLAAMTGRSVKTIERALKYLEAAKLLVRVHRHGAQGWRTSDRYELQVDVLTVDLPDKTPTSQTAHKAERLQGNLSGLPDNLSSPTRQGDGAEENHQYESPEESLVSSSETHVTDIVRTDVEELCSLLRDSILSNGVRKNQAVITDTWRNSARLGSVKNSV
ncbi:hypothetical protein B7R21_06445 [Subtercola boreus]|uniref:Helix-turn-helix domain-containing protein n=1 Tax=Subtercola boreus TaxID=120213 RepID=A0A3E0VY37_9MICO|nr:helix-turn-helix domain-containing protein [Subtercola boreus]RFA14233.1 hypothetical protein B7R21_06445 [Subtercola boreus]